MLENKIAVLRGNRATSLFDNPQFSESWDKLFESCPWATVFQSRDFVTSWLYHFQNYTPYFITDWDGASLTGLLPLVEFKGEFTAPGIDLAEYQVWLAFPEDNEKFIKAALSLFNKTFPKGILYLKYIPDTKQIELVGKDSYLAPRSVWKAYQRPMMEADKDWLQQELKKKNRKEKINRLKRLGEFEFVHLTDFDDFNSAIEGMALQSDFRKAALYNNSSFHDEPKRKEFLLSLFRMGLLHVSILRVGEFTIAANAGIMSKGMVHLQGINSHSPFHSKHSPGILHFLMLGVELADSNIPFFDLTPGGAEGYKSLLANRHDLAYEFWYGPRFYILVKKNKLKIKAFLKSKLQGKKILEMDLSDPNVLIQQLKNNISFWVRTCLKFLKKDRINLVKNQTKQLYFSWKKESGSIEVIQDSKPDFNTGEISKNKISDLFLWENNGSIISRMELFQDCLARIENGQEMFTIVSDNVLNGICWCIPATSIKGNVAKSQEQPDQMPLRLSCSYYVIGKESLVINCVGKIIANTKSQQVPFSGFTLELAKDQKELVQRIFSLSTWILDKN
ncbi:GNAT family N-acetyltransferase [Aquiflexum sp. LQ15W]|uniref:GNAT family N-acetyltransferase n=1 Tax=Cognataquiflexum nitidum TaxID=2922272 RepID=UPI001F143FDF|nr:GNAT family N-acetyltransferase [Cognataquiflexum nitidum]MCH6201424.1 GNAT family N-acetyltransferase [Cognataquiflexum nitidum]